MIQSQVTNPTLKLMAQARFGTGKRNPSCVISEVPWDRITYKEVFS